MSAKLSVGQEIGLTAVKKMLDGAGYEYAVKGDIIDVILPGGGNLARIMFDGDKIEDIKIIDNATLRAVKKVGEIDIRGDMEFSLMIDTLRAHCPDFDFSGVNSPTAVLPNYSSAVGVLAEEIAPVAKAGSKTVLLFVGNQKTAENYFKEHGIDFVVTSGRVAKNRVNIIRENFTRSFEIGSLGLQVYTLTAGAMGTTHSAPPTALITKAKNEFIMPLVGECVVHSFHGIGRFMGVKHMAIAERTDDYFVLQYDGGTVVYLPVGKAEMLSNYVGEPTRLHKIGGQDFANAKQRVRRHLRELSFKLSELYQKRAGARANVYEIDPATSKAFADSFQFPLTADQEKVMADIFADMGSGKIMDRLVCGDVGYGKTEIAFRTAFAAVMNGYQVVFLCPTTILSMQHFNLAVSRFAKFGVRVAVFNRFVSAKESAKVLDGLQSGDIDMVIGTHKLLSLTAADFKNLGLLILDEEQRFGVEAKEKIKKITNNIDVLTMSATPIPRTLNMSLIGLRDISVITTPPKDRLPVITTAAEFSWELLIDAIGRETSRGGQVIILYNTVETIADFTAKLQKLLHDRGNAKGSGGDRKAPIVAFLHGQMNTSTIEDAIIKVYEKEIDVIVASTIIENGIDLTTANTLFVVNADKLGIAQMHQLRGRVGRGSVQAYAYFTYSKAKFVSEESMERINAIKNFYSTGAGFNIAMRDLELRGSGEVLGANQSGHIEEIGMEAFAQILNEIAEENRAAQL